MARRLPIPAAAAALMLSACNLAPPHQRPDLPTPSSYPAQPPPAVAKGTEPPPAVATGTQPAPAVSYRSFFPDPRLQALIALGLDRNRDLAINAGQVAEAAGFARIERAAQFPELDASGSIIRNRPASSDADGQSAARSRYAAGILVPAFELDFWGRLRNLSAAARSQYLASLAGEQAARLALVRLIATNHFVMLEADERIALAVATVDSRDEGLRIAKLRLDAGVTSALDYRQAETLLTQAETELAALRLTRAEAINRIRVLVGGDVPADLPEPLPLARQLPGPMLAAGLPSDLLTARPDIIAAEEQLRAARANIGAARAAFLPAISLTGGLGYASADLASLFDSSGLNWSFGPAISMPLFDWGRRRGNVDVAVAREVQAVAGYELVVQEAFREVADALAGRRFLAEEVAAQERATQAQQEIARLARIRYREGVANYLEVLDAERNLFTAEQQLIVLRRLELSNHAALLAALGGGLP